MGASVVDFIGSYLEKLISHKRRPQTNNENDIPGGQKVEERDDFNLYSDGKRSRLFMNVIQSTRPDESPREALSNKTRSDNENYSYSRQKNIGLNLRRKVDAISVSGDLLSRYIDRDTAQYINHAIEEIKQLSVHVAFVGQANTGKSSLINALARQPNFLPTDVNPWTTVVTKLHFGLPGASSGATFDFFNWDEWERLAQGNRRVKELTTRLVPDFDWDAFRQQVQTLHDQAKARLGPQFEALIGTQHTYDSATAEILERYVCAEPLEPHASAGTKAGELSCVTKLANIYLDLGCFSFPTTLIDTPGVNDPFLVRDEITRQNLELADVYIVVLNARQPLSTADVRLLRMLQGVEKEKLIVFVNKIDEIENFDRYKPGMLKRIRDILRREIAAEDIPVEFGSAYLANMALTGNYGQAHQYMSNLHSIEVDDLITTYSSESYWKDESAATEKALETIFLHSGVSALTEKLSTLMQKGPVPVILVDMINMLIAIAQNAELLVEKQKNLIERALEHSDTGDEAMRELVSCAVDQVNSLESEMSSQVDVLTESALAAVDRQTDALRTELTEIVAGFARSQSQSFLAHHETHNSSPWNCKTVPLRLELEAACNQTIRGLYEEIASLQHSAGGGIFAIAQKSEMGETFNIVCWPLLSSTTSLSLPPLSEMSSVDPDSPGWQQWDTQAMTLEMQADHIKTAILDDFGAIIDNVSSLILEQYKEYITKVEKHFHAIIINALAEQKKALGKIDGILMEEEVTAALTAELTSCRRHLQTYRWVISTLKPHRR